MTIQEIMKRIKLSEEAQCVVQEQKMTEEDYERWKVPVSDRFEDVLGRVEKPE